MASSLLQLGRESVARRDWAQAYQHLAAADAQSPLDVEDLQLLFVAAHLTGRDAERNALAIRAFHDLIAAGDIPRAVRCAFYLVMGLSDQREYAQAGGWLGRARELLEASGLDCVEQGYVLVPAGVQSLGAGDTTGALATFAQAGKIAERFGDADLMTMSRLGRGRGLINLGEVEEGAGLLDQVMVAVTSGEVSPIVSGVVYCAVIEACGDIFDLRRAQEWTTALTYWCSTQPGLVPYRGQCLVYRVEVMRMHGAWPDAFEEVRRACELLGGPPVQTAAPMAYYQRAELHRLRGQLDQAEEDYRLTARLGGSVQPGQALLRLAQGRVKSAASSIRLALEAARLPTDRVKLLGSCVDVLLAAGDIEGARAAAAELAQAAEALNAPLLAGRAGAAAGSVLLAEGEHGEALPTLRKAWRTLTELDVPYEAARARVLLGLAHRRLGDEDTARMELDAARWVFLQLGALRDLAEVDRLLAGAREPAPGGLSSREIEVLRLVAEGKTNKAIAAELFLSEKTVARHVSNIFTKLGVTSRSAATAYAYQHDLVEG